MVGMMWKDESGEGKQAWKHKAEQVKIKHAQLHPGYSYQPRRPAEKRRRASNRKGADVQQLALPSSIQYALDASDPSITTNSGLVTHDQFDHVFQRECLNITTATDANLFIVSGGEAELDHGDLCRIMAEDMTAEQYRQLALTDQLADFSDIFASEMYQPFAPFDLS
jgi:hypothetical protein